MRWKDIKRIFPLWKSAITKVKVSTGSMRHEDDERWIEVPDDYCKDITFEQLQRNGILSIVIEKRQGRDQIVSRRNDALLSVLELHSAHYIAPWIWEYLFSDDGIKKCEWPRSKGEDWRENLQVGDIIDVRDKCHKWYESMVRYIYPKKSEHYGNCIVHYIGWKLKWNKMIALDSDRLAKRNRHTKGPYRRKTKSRKR